jgi:uncharacterized protein (TIGR02996 family)
MRLAVRTFEFNDGKSQKFWNIALKGSAFTVTYGRMGAKGQTQTKTFKDAAKAQAAHDKLVAEKLAKGYVETTAGTTATPTAKVLENALSANPDDLAAHAAYADWLTQQGDPRGEFIQVQLALEDASCSAKERKQLQGREKDLLQKHRSEWLGDLAEYLRTTSATGWAISHGTADYEFSRGWLDSLRIPELTVNFARVLVKAPQARLLRRLAIEEVVAFQEPGEFEPGPDVPENCYYPAAWLLARSPHLGNVRVFQLGENPGEDLGGGLRCRTNGEAAVDLAKKMPLLEELLLFAHAVPLEQLFSLKTLNRLRVLQVYHCHHYPLERLARNPALGRLTHLLLFPHALEPNDPEEAYITLKGVRAVVNSSHLTSLTHLRLGLTDMGDAGCEAIIRSGILRRLKVLDLRHGRVTDEGARLLAACPDLRNLELLNLYRNALTDEGIRALRAVGIKLDAGDQHAVDDTEYLIEGDWE